MCYQYRCVRCDGFFTQLCNSICSKGVIVLEGRCFQWGRMYCIDMNSGVVDYLWGWKRGLDPEDPTPRFTGMEDSSPITKIQRITTPLDTKELEDRWKQRFRQLREIESTLYSKSPVHKKRRRNNKVILVSSDGEQR